MTQKPKLDELSVIDFSEELGSDAPAPGGGSTAALSGAMSCSLICMVAKITLKKSQEPNVNIRLKEIITEAETARLEFLKLINDDTEAFNKIMESFRMPKNTDAEKQVRSKSIQSATKHAAEVPLTTARLAFQALEWSKELTELGTKNAITDTGVAGLSAFTSLRGALWNVKINLGSIKDSGFVQETNLEIERMLEATNQIWPAIIQNVEKEL